MTGEDYEARKDEHRPDWPGYMTAEEFVRGVLDVAYDCGYGWMNEGKHHPEDIAVNLGPVMVAYAAGMSEAIRRQAKR